LSGTSRNCTNRFYFQVTAISNGVGKKLEDMERAHILRVVEECGGNQSHAAEILDIDRVTPITS